MSNIATRIKALEQRNSPAKLSFADLLKQARERFFKSGCMPMDNRLERARRLRERMKMEGML